jgi:hypothetical protein
LKLKFDELLSNVAFNFNLRRHTLGSGSPGGGGTFLVAAGGTLARVARGVAAGVTPVSPPGRAVQVDPVKPT